ncbi:MAG: helix-turn-helix transcriptional regulator [Rhodoferax sp.]
MKTSRGALLANNSLEAVQTFATPRSTVAQAEVRLYRLPDVLERIPVSRSSWFAGIQLGRYPRGHHLGPRTTVWRSDDIDRLIQSLEVVA